MSPERLFKVSEFLQPADGEPIRSVITESADAAVVAWSIKPGQQISAHVHPGGSLKARQPEVTTNTLPIRSNYTLGYFFELN